jgi:hypothetical protein
MLDWYRRRKLSSQTSPNDLVYICSMDAFQPKSSDPNQIRETNRLSLGQLNAIVCLSRKPTISSPCSPQCGTKN